MADLYDVILAPIVTEKTSEQMENENLYTFIVDGAANKIEIGKAVERLWDVTVKDVRTMRYSGKARRSFLGSMARNYSKGRLVLSLEDPKGMIMFGLRGEVLEGRVREPDEVLAGLDAVTADDVQRVAQDLVRGERLNLALIGPFDDEDRFRDVLALPSS